MATHLSQEGRKQLRLSSRRWRHHAALLAAHTASGRGSRPDAVQTALLLRMCNLSALSLHRPRSLAALQQLATLSGLTSICVLSQQQPAIQLLPLLSLPDLRSLHLISCKHTSMRWLTQLSALKLDNKTPSTASLPRLTSLRRLDICDPSHLHRLTALRQLSRLSLQAFEVQWHQWRPRGIQLVAAALPSLASLRVLETSLPDHTVLARLVHLTALLLHPEHRSFSVHPAVVDLARHLSRLKTLGLVDFCPTSLVAPSITSWWLDLVTIHVDTALFDPLACASLERLHLRLRSDLVLLRNKLPRQRFNVAVQVVFGYAAELILGPAIEACIEQHAV